MGGRAGCQFPFRETPDGRVAASIARQLEISAGGAVCNPRRERDWNGQLVKRATDAAFSFLPPPCTRDFVRAAKPTSKWRRLHGRFGRADTSFSTPMGGPVGWTKSQGEKGRRRRRRCYKDVLPWFKRPPTLCPAACLRYEKASI